ncbi:MAG TPA: hypothetical protein VGM90_05280 [Kofleriaceae bacterium]
MPIEAFNSLVHLDDQGQPCTTHPEPPVDALLSLAVIGSRAGGFNHDIASKLQGLMMALDEISELGEQDSNLARSAESAHTALKEVLSTLNVNRAMTKPPSRAPISLPELWTRAGERVYVTLKGQLPTVDVEVSAATMTQALALALDVCGGPGRGRAISADVAQTATHVTVTFPAVMPLPSNAAEALAIATYVLARDGGSFTCCDGGKSFAISLPLAK